MSELLFIFPSSFVREEFAHDGIRRSIDAVLVAENHGHPHIFLLQLGPEFWKLYAKSPPSIPFPFTYTNCYMHFHILPPLLSPSLPPLCFHTHTHTHTYTHNPANFSYSPGGELQPGEDVSEGLSRLLNVVLTQLPFNANHFALYLKSLCRIFINLNSILEEVMRRSSIGTVWD